MNRKIIITPEGYSILKKKIARLEKIKQETAERLSLTIGDLSENADFIVLDEKNQNLFKEIEESRSYLERAEIREKSNSKSFIGLGSIVTYSRFNGQEKLTIELTDDTTADPPRKISVNSPFGENLLEKKVGDIVHQGKNKYQILEIK
jgi:transcription elongation GreA/GreB family factor